MRSVKWEFNDSCNLRCPYCIAERMRGRVLSFEQKCQVIQRLLKLGVEHIDFFGKEPLFDREIFDLIAYCEKESPRPITYTFITNGVNLSKYKEDILASPIKDFTVSTSGDVGRGFMVDWKLLDWFFDKDIDVAVSFDVIEQNRDDLYKWYRVFEHHAASSVYFKPIIPVGLLSGATLQYSLGDIDYLLSIIHLLSYQNKQVPFGTKLDISVPHFFPHTMQYGRDKQNQVENVTFLLDEKCTAGHDRIFVDAYGYAYGCGMACYAGNTVNRINILNEVAFDHLVSRQGIRQCGGSFNA